MRRLVAPRQVESSWTKDRTCVSCTDRQILDPWTTREVLAIVFSAVTAKELKGVPLLGNRGQTAMGHVIRTHSQAIAMLPVDS